MGRKPSKTPTKADAITVRLHPRVKYGLELAAKRERRTISAVVEDFIQRGLENDGGILGETTETILDELWDPDECERLINLATKYPNLLSYEEELMWKAIREIEYFHVDTKMRENNKKRYYLDAIRMFWEDLNELGQNPRNYAELVLELQDLMDKEKNESEV